MTISIFKVKKPGLFTTIQDAGRQGYQSLGIPVSGAMDSYSHRMANLLVGNRLDAAVLEITLIGPVLEVETEAIISICGADMTPRLNGTPVPMWTSIPVKKEDVLSFEKLSSGARAYVGVAGELAVPIVLGSQSTETKASMGGYAGRPLTSGDRLYGHPLPKGMSRRTLKPEQIPQFTQDMTLRIVLGPHEDYFSTESVNKLLTETFTITSKSDRMGYRLEGDRIPLKRESSIHSEATSFGSLQVPSSGKPIILMADRQTTGGYPIIGSVIAVDLPHLAQALPGANVQFQEISLERAQSMYRRREEWLQLLERLHKIN